MKPVCPSLSERPDSPASPLLRISRGWGASVTSGRWACQVRSDGWLWWLVLLKVPLGKGQLTRGTLVARLISKRQSVRSQGQEPAGVPGPHRAVELRGRAMPATISSMWNSLGRKAERQTLAYATWKPPPPPQFTSMPPPLHQRPHTPGRELCSGWVRAMLFATGGES